MSGTPPVFTAEAVRDAVGVDDALEAARQAFRALHEGTVTSPTPWHLDVPEHGGAVHVKGAATASAPYLAVKLSTGFPGNAGRGLPTSDGMTAVIDAETGAIAALLLDGGYLTELRTGAAGALALDAVGAEEIEELAVLGTGGQARFQIEAALRVRRPQRISVHGRDRRRADAFAAWVRERTDARVDVQDLDDRPITAQAIITVTAATAPVLRSHQVAPGTHITAIGSDGPGKRELDPALVLRADLVVVDVLEQSRSLGELQGVDVPAGRVVTLGAHCSAAPPRPAGAVTIADLSGTGAQDAAIASLAMRRLLGLRDPAST